MIGVVVTILYVLDGSIKSMNSAWNGPTGQLVRAMGSCFHPETKIRLKNGNVRLMKDLDLGDVLEDGSIVESVMKIDNKREKIPLYAIKEAGIDKQDIFVTGSHLVFDKKMKEFIKVENYSKAVACFRKAARKGNQEAQQNLSFAYKEGHGVKKDLSLATYWLLKSCSTDEGCSITISFHRDLIKFIAPVLVEFPEFRHLKKIEFHRLGLSGEGIPAIANLIQANPAIETLDLSGNDIDDADALMLVTALENNTNLKRLIFNADGVHPATLARIDALLSQYSATT
jgi:hypothetical protein